MRKFLVIVACVALLILIVGCAQLDLPRLRDGEICIGPPANRWGVDQRIQNPCPMPLEAPKGKLHV